MICRFNTNSFKIIGSFFFFFPENNKEHWARTFLLNSFERWCLSVLPTTFHCPEPRHVAKEQIPLENMIYLWSKKKQRACNPESHFYYTQSSVPQGNHRDIFFLCWYRVILTQSSLCNWDDDLTSFRSFKLWHRSPNSSTRSYFKKNLNYFMFT